MRAKKLLSLLLVCVMLLGLFPASAFAASYGDTQGHWAQAAIERWSDYGIVTGDGQGFRPNDNMTRAEAATVFSRLFGLSDAAAKTTFTDVAAKDWFYEAVNKCVNAGIMNGVGDNKMNPNGTMTREMFFVMFARALGLKEQSSTKGLTADGDSWANGYINALTDRGYVRGMDGKVNALANIDRASVMALLDQTIKQYVNTSGTTTLNADKGIVLVNAKNVTLTGTTAADIVIAQGADGGNVDFVKATVTGAVIAQAANAVITSDKDSAITTPVINGANTVYNPKTVAAGGGSYVDPATQAPQVAGDLSDEVYAKDLTIGAEFGDGEVALERVTVNGTLYVRGGGEHSIVLKDCTINNIEVKKPESAGTEETRLLLNGTSPAAITASSGTIIETPEGKEATVGTITATNNVTLKGDASVGALMTTEGNGANIVLDESYNGSVEKVTVTASGSATIIANAGTIGEVEATGAATIAGSSTTAIQSVKAVGDVTIDTKVATVEATSGANLTLGAGADVENVTAAGDLTISGASGDAGKIGTLTATTGAITVNAPTAQIAKVEAKAVENGTTANNTVAITVTSGTVSEVVASAANTTVSGGDKGTVANVTANNAVRVDAKTVEKVTVATTETITVDDTASGTSSKIDVAVTGGTAVNLATTSDADNAIEVSSTDASADVSSVSITKSTGETTPVTHVHTWDAGVINKGDEPTCTEDGKMTYTCRTPGCTAGADGGSLTKTVVIPATGHKWSTTGVETTPAGHTVTGVLTYYCENNDDHTYTETIPATGHSDSDTWINDPGAHWHVCEKDDAVFGRSAHNFYNAVELDGSKVIVTPTCSVCGYEDAAKELETAAYLQLAYEEKTVDGVPVRTITGIGLKNSSNRSFYTGSAPAEQTVTIVSTLAFAEAATDVSNWTVKNGSGNDMPGLKLDKVELSGDKKTATLTFIPQDVDDSADSVTYDVSGALRITPNAAALGEVADVQVTLANPEGYVKAGVPGPVAVSNYAATVDRWGTITVEGPKANTTVTKYLVNKNPADALKALAKKSYQLTAKSKVEKALAKSNDGPVSAFVGSLFGDKSYNGKYLVAVVYENTGIGSESMLTGYGVSSAINVNGFVPDALSATLDRSGNITVTRVNETKWVAGEEGASGAWASTMSGVEVTDNELYLVRPSAGVTPAFNLDTLSTEKDGLNLLKTLTGKDSAESNLVTLKTAAGWKTLTADSDKLTADYNGCYLVSVIFGDTNNRDAATPSKTFSDRVVAFGASKVNLSTVPQISLLTDTMTNNTKVLGKLPSALVSSDTTVTTKAASAANTYDVTVKGKAYDISGWTQFSGITAEQSGHFLPLRITKPAVDTASGTLRGSGAVTNFEFTDENDTAEYLVLRVDTVKDAAANATFKNKFVVTATVGTTNTTKYTFNIDVSKLELEHSKSELVFGASNVAKLFGKAPSDLVESYDVTANPGNGTYAQVITVTGEAQYIVKWNDFSGAEKASTGYYVPLKITKPDDLSNVDFGEATLTMQGVGEDKTVYTYNAANFFGGTIKGADYVNGDDLVVQVGGKDATELTNFIVTIDWDGEGTGYTEAKYLIDLSGMTLEKIDNRYIAYIQYKNHVNSAEEALNLAIGTDDSCELLFPIKVGNIVTDVTVCRGTDTFKYAELSKDEHVLWAAYRKDGEQVIGKYGTIEKTTIKDPNSEEQIEALKVDILGDPSTPEAYAGTAGYLGEVTIFYTTMDAPAPTEVDDKAVLLRFTVAENPPTVEFVESWNDQAQYTIPAASIINVDVKGTSKNTYELTSEKKIPFYQPGEMFSFAGKQVNDGHFVAVRVNLEGNYDPKVATIAVSGADEGSPVTIWSAKDAEISTLTGYYVDLILRLDDVMSGEKAFTVSIDWDGSSGKKKAIDYKLDVSKLTLDQNAASARLTYAVNYTTTNGITGTREYNWLDLLQGSKTNSITVTADSVYGTVPVWDGKTFRDVAIKNIGVDAKIAVVIGEQIVNDNFGKLSVNGDTITIQLDGEGHKLDGYAGAFGAADFFVYTAGVNALPDYLEDSDDDPYENSIFALYVEPGIKLASKINEVYGTGEKVDLFGDYEESPYDETLYRATLSVSGTAKYATVTEFMNSGDVTLKNGYYLPVEMPKPLDFTSGYVVIELKSGTLAIPVSAAFDEQRTDTYIDDHGQTATGEPYSVLEMVIKISDATPATERNWKVYYCYGAESEDAAKKMVKDGEATYTYTVDYSNVKFASPTAADLTYKVVYTDVYGAEHTATVSELSYPKGTVAKSIKVTASSATATVPVFTGESFTKIAVSALNGVKVAAVMGNEVVNPDFGETTLRDKTLTITLGGAGHQYDGYAGKTGVVYFYLYTGENVPKDVDVANALYKLTVTSGTANLQDLLDAQQTVTLSGSEKEGWTATVGENPVPLTVTLPEDEDKVFIAIPDGAKLTIADGTTYEELDANIMVSAGGELWLGEQPVFFTGTETDNGGTLLTKGDVQIQLKEKTVQFLSALPGDGDHAEAAEATVYGWPYNWSAEIQDGAKVTFTEAAYNSLQNVKIVTHVGGELYIGKTPVVTPDDRSIQLVGDDVIAELRVNITDEEGKKIGPDAMDFRRGGFAVINNWNVKARALLEDHTTALFPTQEAAAQFMSTQESEIFYSAQVGIGTPDQDNYYLILGPEGASKQGDHYLAMQSPRENSSSIFVGHGVVVIFENATIPAGKIWTTNWGGEGDYQVELLKGATLTVNGTMYVTGELVASKGTLAGTGKVILNSDDAIVVAKENVKGHLALGTEVSAGSILGEDITTHNQGEPNAWTEYYYSVVPQSVTKIIAANVATKDTYQDVINIKEFKLTQDFAASYSWKEEDESYTYFYDVHGVFNVGNIAKHATSSGGAEPSWWIGVAVPQDVIINLLGVAKNGSFDFYSGYSVPDEILDVGEENSDGAPQFRKLERSSLTKQKGSYMYEVEAGSRYFTFYFNAVKAAKEGNCIFFVLQNETGTKCVNYVIDVDAVVTDGSVGDTVVPAPLHDNAKTDAIADADLYKKDSYKVDGTTDLTNPNQVNVTVSIDDLKPHENAEGLKAYWVGVGIAHADNVTYKTGFDRDNLTDGNPGVMDGYDAFYFGSKSGDFSGKTAYIVAEYDGGTTTTYVLDLRGVHIKNVAPTEPTGNELSEG